MREGRSRAFRTQKGEARTPACFGLGRAIPRLPRGRKGGSELRAPAELIAPTEAPVARGIPRSAPFGVPRAMREKAEAESFAPKKGESRTPPCLFWLNRAITRRPRGAKGARTSRPRPSSSRRRRLPWLAGSRPRRPPWESRMRDREKGRSRAFRTQKGESRLPLGEWDSKRGRRVANLSQGRARTAGDSHRRDHALPSPFRAPPHPLRAPAITASSFRWINSRVVE